MHSLEPVRSVYQKDLIMFCGYVCKFVQGHGYWKFAFKAWPEVILSLCLLNVPSDVNTTPRYNL